MDARHEHSNIAQRPRSHHSCVLRDSQDCQQQQPAYRTVGNRGFRHFSVEFELNSKSYTFYCRQDSTGNSRTKPQIKRQFKIAALQTRSPTTPTALPRPWVTYYVRIFPEQISGSPAQVVSPSPFGSFHCGFTMYLTTGLWTVVATYFPVGICIAIAVP